MIRVVHPGSRIRMLTFSHPGFQIQGSKRHPIPDPGSGSVTLRTSVCGYGILNKSFPDTDPGLRIRTLDYGSYSFFQWLSRGQQKKKFFL